MNCSTAGELVREMLYELTDDEFSEQFGFAVPKDTDRFSALLHRIATAARAGKESEPAESAEPAEPAEPPAKRSRSS